MAGMETLTAQNVEEELKFLSSLDWGSVETCSSLSIGVAGGCKPWTIEAVWTYTDSFSVPGDGKVVQKTTQSAVVASKTSSEWTTWKVIAPIGADLSFVVTDVNGAKKVTITKPLSVTSNALGLLPENMCGPSKPVLSTSSDVATSLHGKFIANATLFPVPEATSAGGVVDGAVANTRSSTTAASATVTKANDLEHESMLAVDNGQLAQGKTIESVLASLLALSLLALLVVSLLFCRTRRRLRRAVRNAAPLPSPTPATTVKKSRWSLWPWQRHTGDVTGGQRAVPATESSEKREHLVAGNSALDSDMAGPLSKFKPLTPLVLPSASKISHTSRPRRQASDVTFVENPFGDDADNQARLSQISLISGSSRSSAPTTSTTSQGAHSAYSTEFYTTRKATTMSSPVDSATPTTPRIRKLSNYRELPSPVTASTVAGFRQMYNAQNGGNLSFSALSGRQPTDAPLSAATARMPLLGSSASPFDSQRDRFSDIAEDETRSADLQRSVTGSSTSSDYYYRYSDDEDAQSDGTERPDIDAESFSNVSFNDDESQGPRSSSSITAPSSILHRQS